MANKRLYKSTTNRQVMGVAGGIAEYFNIDATIVRVIFFFLMFGWSAGFWLYIALAVILPNDYQVNGGKKQTPPFKTTTYTQNFSSSKPKDVTPKDSDNWDDF